MNNNGKQVLISFYAYGQYKNLRGTVIASRKHTERRGIIHRRSMEVTQYAVDTYEGIYWVDSDDCVAL